MTRLFRSLSAALLAVALLISLTACGAPQNDTLIGTWEYQFVAPGSFGGDEGMVQYLTLTLREDLTFTFGPDADKMRPAIAQSIDAFVEDALATDGNTKTAEQFYEENGATREEMIDELLTMMVAAGGDGTYKTEDNKLYLQFNDTDPTPDEYYTYAFDSGRLVLTLPEGISPTYQIAPGEEFPLTMSRVA